MWGWTARYLLANPSRGWENENVGSWARSYGPDVVLALLGTPDMHEVTVPLDSRISAILTTIGKIIDTLRVVNPSVVVLLANLYPTNSVERTQEIEVFNTHIPGLAGEKTTTASPVIFVDLWTGFDRTRDLVDPLHANQSGCTRIAYRFLDGLWPFFDSVPPIPLRAGHVSSQPPPRLGWETSSPWMGTGRQVHSLFTVAGRWVPRLRPSSAGYVVVIPDEVPPIPRGTITIGR